MMLLSIDTTFIVGIPRPVLILMILVFALIILIRLFKTPGLTGKWAATKVSVPEQEQFSSAGLFLFLGIILFFVIVATLVVIGVFDELLVSQAESGLVYVLNIEKEWIKIWIREIFGQV